MWTKGAILCNLHTGARETKKIFMQIIKRERKNRNEKKERGK